MLKHDALKVLESLRPSFQEAANRYPQLRHMLVHGRIRRFDRQGPTPLFDLTTLDGTALEESARKCPPALGNLFVEDDGWHPVCTMSTYFELQSSWYFFGVSPKDPSYTLYVDLATSAGRCMRALLSPDMLNKTTSFGMLSEDPARLWLSILYDLAHTNHPSVTAKFFVKEATTIIPVDQLERLRKGDPKKDFGAAVAQRIPPDRAEFAILKPGLFLSSVFAIDAMVAHFQGSSDREASPARTPPGAPDTPTTGTQAPIDEMADWISSTELKDRCGIDPNTVLYRARRNGWRINKQGALNHYLRSEIRKNYREETRDPDGGFLI